MPVPGQRAWFRDFPFPRGNLAQRASLMVKAANQTAGKPNAQAPALVQLQATAIWKRKGRELHPCYHYADTVATMVMTPIAMVMTPTPPCRPRLAQVSHRAETAGGAAIAGPSA